MRARNKQKYTADYKNDRRIGEDRYGSVAECISGRESYLHKRAFGDVCGILVGTEAIYYFFIQSK